MKKLRVLPRCFDPLSEGSESDPIPLKESDKNDRLGDVRRSWSCGCFYPPDGTRLPSALSATTKATAYCSEWDSATARWSMPSRSARFSAVP